MNSRKIVALCALPAVAAAAALALPRTQSVAAPQIAAPTTDPAVALRGKAAPAFTLPDQNDKPRSLADSKGKWTVLAFYPADMTSGCTFQNISYSKNNDKFAALNAVVYTVSTQNTDSKKQFCSKEGLTHTLLSDVGGNVAKSYGVLSGGYARRVTFYIAPDGKIAAVDTQIDVNNAAPDSLRKLAQLQKPKTRTAAPATTEVRTTPDGQAVVTTSSPAQFVGPSSVKVTLNAPVPDFALPDSATGKTAAFSTLSAGKSATVLVFISTNCPVSNAYNERMEQIATTYGAKGVAFVGINSNVGETPTSIASHSRTNGFTFPVLKDASDKVADQFSARVTPEVFVADSKGTLVYHGPIDDSQETGEVKHKFLAQTLDALVAGQPVPAATPMRAFGCGIRRAR